MNFILRKSTNQLSKNRYEKHRIEHRGGTHDIVDYDGHGNFNTFGDARNYTIEEQVATGTADDRSYFETRSNLNLRFRSRNTSRISKCAHISECEAHWNQTVFLKT